MSSRLNGMYSDSLTFRVKLGDPPFYYEGGHVVYHLVFQMGDIVHVFAHRYSNLLERHNIFQASVPPGLFNPGQEMPSFPGKRSIAEKVLSSPEEITLKRARDVVEYFEILASNPRILMSTAFHRMLDIWDPLARDIIRFIAKNMMVQDSVLLLTTIKNSRVGTVPSSPPPSPHKAIRKKSHKNSHKNDGERHVKFLDPVPIKPSGKTHILSGVLYDRKNGTSFTYKPIGVKQDHLYGAKSGYGRIESRYGLIDRNGNSIDSISKSEDGDDERDSEEDEGGSPPGFSGLAETDRAPMSIIKPDNEAGGGGGGGGGGEVGVSKTMYSPRSKSHMEPKEIPKRIVRKHLSEPLPSILQGSPLYLKQNVKAPRKSRKSRKPKKPSEEKSDVEDDLESELSQSSTHNLEALRHELYSYVASSSMEELRSLMYHRIDTIVNKRNCANAMLLTKLKEKFMRLRNEEGLLEFEKSDIGDLKPPKKTQLQNVLEQYDHEQQPLVANPEELAGVQAEV